MENSNELKISFNSKFGTIRVYKTVIAVLNNPKYVFFTWEEDTKRLSVYGTDEMNNDCLLVARHHDKNDKGGLKLHGTAFIRRLGSYVGWRRDKTYIATGVLNSEIRRVDFDLSTAVENQQVAQNL